LTHSNCKFIHRCLYAPPSFCEDLL
jgi:hypothetical protein